MIIYRMTDHHLSLYSYNGTKNFFAKNLKNWKLSIVDKLELATVSLACIELAVYIYFYRIIVENPKNGSQFHSRVNLLGNTYPFQHSTSNRFYKRPILPFRVTVWKHKMGENTPQWNLHRFHCFPISTV